MKSKINFLVLLLLFSPILIAAQTNNLQGKWNFLILTESGEDVSLPDSSRNQSITFNKNGEFFSSVICNNLSGKYSFGKPGKIKFSSTIITAKRCFDDGAEIERSFASVLKKTTEYQIKDSVLTLRDASGMNVVTLTKNNEPEQIIPRDWEEFMECGFTFLAPPTLQELKPGQTDSCTADFENKDLRISIAYGNYGERFRKSDSMTEFKEETIEIDNRKTQLVTYIDNFTDGKNQQQRKYVTGIYVSVINSANGEDAVNSLVMKIEGKEKKDLETAKRIFRTIEFQ